MDLVSRVRGRQSKCTAMCSQMSVGNKHFRQKEAQGGFRGCLVWSNNYHLHQYITLSLISFQNHSSCRECPKLCCKKLSLSLLDSSPPAPPQTCFFLTLSWTSGIYYSVSRIFPCFHNFCVNLFRTANILFWDVFVEILPLRTF